MKIRKIKKQLKLTNDEWIIKVGLDSLKLIRKWAKINHSNSKSNMKILTNNFYRKRKIIK